MDVPATVDRPDNVLGKEETNNVPNVVGAHSQLEVLKPGASLDGRGLHGVEKRFDSFLQLELHPTLKRTFMFLTLVQTK